MPATFTTLFTTYLIYPILALVMVLIAAIIARKNGLTKNKRLITYTLLTMLILAAPALLGFLGHNFMPWAYLALTGVYIIAGWHNDRLLPWAFKKEELKYRVQIIYTVFQVILGMLLFTLVFNFCNELKYGLWASTCMLAFVLPSLLFQCYRIFIHIPVPIYKVWRYDEAPDFAFTEDIDHSKLKVVKVEVFKREEDLQFTRINVKVPEEILLGEWIKWLFDDYNRKWSHSPIDVHSDDDEGWIFYIKSWALAPRRYIDHELTVKENRIREKHLIVAKRVKNLKEER